jgi:hypothetical protein
MALMLLQYGTFWKFPNVTKYCDVSGPGFESWFGAGSGQVRDTFNIGLDFLQERYI